MVKVAGNKKPSLPIVTLLAAMKSFAVTVRGKIVLMKVTTRRIPHMVSGLLLQPVICPYRKRQTTLPSLGPPKHFIDPDMIRRVESRMLIYTRIEPLMEIKAAGGNVLRGTAQGITPLKERCKYIHLAEYGSTG